MDQRYTAPYGHGNAVVLGSRSEAQLIRDLVGRTRGPEEVT